MKFVGGREVVGILKGADPISNLVLDEAVEYLRGNILIHKKYIDANDPYKLTDVKREIGVMICRGTTVKL